MIDSKIQYGLQVRQTGELARIQIIWEDGDSPYCREPVAARLSSDPDCSPFLVDDPDDLANVLVRNTPFLILWTFIRTRRKTSAFRPGI